VFGLDFSTPLHLLKTTDINRLVEARRTEGSAEGTIKQHIIAVSGALKYAKSLGYLVDEATTFPTFRREKKEPTYLTPIEEQNLLTALDPNRVVNGYSNDDGGSPHRRQRIRDQYDFVICLLDTGLRFQECAQLQWKNVDLTSGLLFYHSFKANKRQTVHLSDRVLEVLAKREATKRPDQVWVFENDKRTTHRAYHNGWFDRAVERAGITKKFTFHKCRSTYASKLVQAGVSLFEVSQLLNHSDPSTTLVYAALVPTDVSKKAASVLNQISSRKL
jgi:integrase